MEELEDWRTATSDGGNFHGHDTCHEGLQVILII